MGFPLSELSQETLSPYILRIKDLYSAMDAAYHRAADRSGFRCGGCSENCCEERFSHYTLAEHLYLLEGWNALDEETAAGISARAEEAVGHYRLQDLQGRSERVMCPLNVNGLCRLYEYRPMICRLQGIPHRIKKPGDPEQTGPGCHKFAEGTAAGDPSDPEFDRTEFYSGMAAIEIELRRLVNFRERYRKTVADMVVGMPKAMDKTHRSILL